MIGIMEMDKEYRIRNQNRVEKKNRFHPLNDENYPILNKVKWPKLKNGMDRKKMKRYKNEDRKSKLKTRPFKR